MDNKARWLEALRSGKYKQGKQRLRKGDSFCCLGVLCDITDSSGWSGDEYLGHTGLAPIDVLRGCGVPFCAAEQLATLNDSGRSFEEIADYIEKKL